ncbi:hypothetical protein ABFA25_02305 [Mycobacterium lepromatosis]|nr:hypothetical protein [Mycobacterium lepromatosis]
MASVLNAKQTGWELVEGDPLLERSHVLFELITLQSNVIGDRISPLVELVIMFDTVFLGFPKYVARERTFNNEDALRVRDSAEVATYQ